MAKEFIGMRVFRTLLVASIVICVAGAAYASIVQHEHRVWMLAAAELVTAGNLLRMTIGYEDYYRRRK
jgi:hypothetical protein